MGSRAALVLSVVTAPRVLQSRHTHTLMQAPVSALHPSSCFQPHPPLTPPSPSCCTVHIETPPDPASVPRPPMPSLPLPLQDMPGWGDDINLMRYLRIVTSFLLEQRAKDYEKLAGSRNLGETAMCGQLQHSITGCLYFLPPHRVKKIDLILMAAISQLVREQGYSSRGGKEGEGGRGAHTHLVPLHPTVPCLVRCLRCLTLPVYTPVFQLLCVVGTLSHLSDLTCSLHCRPLPSCCTAHAPAAAVPIP